MVIAVCFLGSWQERRQWRGLQKGAIFTSQLAGGTEDYLVESRVSLSAWPRRGRLHGPHVARRNHLKDPIA